MTVQLIQVNGVSNHDFAPGMTLAEFLLDLGIGGNAGIDWSKSTILYNGKKVADQKEAENTVLGTGANVYIGKVHSNG